MSSTPSKTNLETTDDVSRQTMQRQADTIDSLHAAAQKYRSRIAALEQQLVVRQAENDSLKVLQTENTKLRDHNVELRERIRDLEQTSSRLTESEALGNESQAQLGVKLQAYQRHNNYLQGEVALRDAKMKALQEKLDVVNEELHAKDRRLTILVEKLRQHNIDPSIAVNKVHVPEDVLANMKQKIATQSATIELLHEKLEGIQEEGTRRESVIEALQRENAALRGSVSRLIRQISGAALAGNESTAADGASPSPIREGSSPAMDGDLETKLAKFRERRAQMAVDANAGGI